MSEQTDGTVTVLVEVVVEKEPTNEAEGWRPTAEAVAAFINGTLVHRDTDEGWRIVGVWEPQSGRSESGTFYCWRCGVRHPYATGCPKDKDD